MLGRIGFALACAPSRPASESCMSRTWLVLLLHCLLCWPVLLQAQQRLMVPELFPLHPSPRDARYVVFADLCDDIDLVSPVTLRRDGDDLWYLDLRASRDEVFCFAPPPPFASTLHAIELPDAVLQADIDVRLILYAGEQIRETLLTSRPAAIPPSITGTWHDAASPGQGINLTLAPGQVLVAHWATFDADGAPLWLVGAGDADAAGGYRRHVPLARLQQGQFPGRGTRPPEVLPWGSALIEYLGCQRLRLSWDAIDDDRFPPGSRELVQYSGEATNPCDLAAFARASGRRLKLHPVLVVP
jgi:hypothetical protein